MPDLANAQSKIVLQGLDPAEMLRHLAAIVQSCDDAIISNDLSGVIMSWNPAAERIFGYCAKEAIGSPISILSTSVRSGEFQKIIESVRHGFKVERHETRHRRKDGSIIDVSVTTFPMVDDEGKVIGVAVIDRDMSQEIQTSQTARNLIEASLDPLVTISREGKITDVNEATEKVTGERREHLIGRDFCDYFTEPERARRGYQRVFAEGSVIDYPLAIRNKSGQVTDVLYNASVYRNAEGKVTGVFAAARDITALKRAEEALRQLNSQLESKVEERTAQLRYSQQRFEYALEGAEEGVWDWDVETGEVWYSPGYKKMLGYFEHEIEPHISAWKRLLHPDDRQTAFSHIEAVLRGKQKFEMEFRVKHKDGHYVSILSRGFPIRRGPDGPIVRIVGTHLDLTERKAAERKLAEHAAEMQTLFDTVPIGLAISLDTEGRHIRGNPVIEKLLGAITGGELSRSSPGSTSYRVLQNGRERNPEDLPMQRAASRGERVQGDLLEIVRSDGSEVILHSNTAPLYDEQGKVRGAVGAFLDITEQKRIENALRGSEARFRFLADNVPDLVWTFNADGECDYLNSRWVEYTGLPAEIQHGYGWLKQIHPEQQDQLMSDWKSAVEHCRPFDSEFRIRAKDGTYRWFKTRAVPVRDEHGQIMKWFSSTIDIEDLRKSQEKLAIANKELESFNYAIAHDLRAPLRHVRVFSDLLEQELRSTLGEKAQHYLSVVQDGVVRMGELIEDLLSLSRIGRQELRKQICGLRRLIDEVVNELQPVIEGRNIDWRIAELPFVECDPALLKQVFANLLSNAVKFTRERNPAIIEIGETNASGEPVIFVRDNGVGFDMKYSNKLFQLFQRLHRQEDFEGTGVGLAIVQRIIHRHGGTVWAEASLNQGATFYISLRHIEPKAPRADQEK